MSAIISIKEDLVQQQILEAAKRLFQVHGLAKVTMDDVAKAIGKGRSSLYYYYKSKDEIFDAVVNIEIREMITAMTRAVNKAPDIEQKLRAFCIAKLETLKEKQPFFRTLDIGMDADALSNFKKAQVIHHNLIIRQESELLEQLLSEGIAKGELRKVTAKELELLIYVLLCCLHGLKREMVMENSFEKIEDVVTSFTHLAMNGLKG